MLVLIWIALAWPASVDAGGGIPSWDVMDIPQMDSVGIPTKSHKVEAVGFHCGISIEKVSHHMESSSA